jgi:Nif-specific regulatory protein
MKAKLAAAGRKKKGEVYFLEAEKTFVGRESVNQIALNDASVSRRHCFIEQKDNAYFISDLESLNGTFVNNSLAADTELKHGDNIRIGDFQFRFLLPNESPELSSGTVRIDETPRELPRNTLRVRLDEAIGAMARDFTALMQISTRINAVRGLDELQKQLLELLFEVVAAEQGAILLLEDETATEFASVFALQRNASEIKDVDISRTIINQVIEEQTAILANDIAADANLAAESLFLAQTASLLCLPIVLYGKTIGIIYLDSDKPAVRFDENNLRLVTAVSGIAAVAIENARRFEWLEAENRRLQAENLQERNMIGESAAMQKVFQFIAKAAPTDATVLINGESGTGKELAARAIHLNSKRRDAPFVAINCAALAETLLESELFGHEKGAFTGAVQQKKGKIEVAAGGTLFLDEIGEMAVALQAKLLRVLQEREFERVGGNRPIKADIRLVAATNRNLEEEVKAGRFRQDLFYRLNVVRFTLPALRERKEDILLLAENFVQKFSRIINRPVRGLSAKAKKILLNYDFPGNVRELENTIERAVVLGSSEWILPEDLPENIFESQQFYGETDNTAETYQEVVVETKKRLIREAFKKAHGSYVEAAKLLDVHPNYLHRLIRNLNLKTELESD